jgi:hypothetical protein
MRKWRVGTLSMGILLIIVGILLLYGELNGISTINLIFTWWPVILITLGIEVLAHVYFSIEESPKIKYDGFSIFIILLIVLVTLSAYGAKLAIENIPALKENFSMLVLTYM